MQVPGLDGNFRDGAMMTPLMWSAFHGEPEHIEKLMERGAGVNFSQKNVFLTLVLPLSLSPSSILPPSLPPSLLLQILL